MLPRIPPNLFYTLLSFSLFGFYNDVQQFLYPTLPLVMENVINSTLIRYNVEPNAMRISILTSLMNVMSSIGTMISVIYFLPIADKKGRKFVCVYIRSIGGFLASVFYLGCAYFESVECFIIAELCFGTSAPIRLFTTSILISESSPDSLRGLATFALMIGNSLVNLVMFSLASPNIFGQPDTWFIFPITTLVLSILCFFLTLRIHESPKWLVRQNRIEEAESAIKFHHGTCNEDDVLDSMIREKNLTVSNKLSFKEVLLDDTLREALIIVSLINALTWISPNAAEIIYSSILHFDVGFKIEQTLAISFLFSLIFIPGQFLGTMLIDKIGRRKLVFLIGTILILKTYLMTATLTISSVFGAGIFTKALMVFIDILANSQHALGLNSIGPLLIAELFPPSARTVVGQVTIFIGVFSFIPITTMFPIIDVIFTPAFYLPFMISQPVILYFIMKKLPETKQRAVCDIIESLENDIISRRATMCEKTPLIRDRSITLAVKRNSDLITQRKRSKTMDYEKDCSNELIVF